MKMMRFSHMSALSRRIRLFTSKRDTRGASFTSISGASMSFGRTNSYSPMWNVSFGSGRAASRHSCTKSITRSDSRRVMVCVTFRRCEKMVKYGLE